MVFELFITPMETKVISEITSTVLVRDILKNIFPMGI